MGSLQKKSPLHTLATFAFLYHWYSCIFGWCLFHIVYCTQIQNRDCSKNIWRSHVTILTQKVCAICKSSIYPPFFCGDYFFFQSDDWWQLIYFIIYWRASVMPLPLLEKKTRSSTLFIHKHQGKSYCFQRWAVWVAQNFMYPCFPGLPLAISFPTFNFLMSLRREAIECPSYFPKEHKQSYNISTIIQTLSTSILLSFPM